MTKLEKGFANLSVKIETRDKLAEMSEVFGKSQSRIVSELIDIIHSVMGSKDCILSYVANPLEQTIEIHIVSRQSWRLSKLYEGMTREQIEKLEREEK